jgi:hypothetical protein
MATTWILVAILVARAYKPSPSLPLRIGLYASAAAALLSKETAAILPLLLGIDAQARRRRSRELVVDLICLTAVMISIGIVRYMWASPALKQPVTKFMLQRWLFGTLGAAALPWHSITLNVARPVVLVEILCCMVLVTLFFVRKAAVVESRFALSMVVWMLVGTVPVITVLGVGPDLQGSRYLYLPSVGWAALLASMASASGSSRVARLIAAVIITLIVATYTVGLEMHLRPWRAAAALRDQVEQAAAQVPIPSVCRNIRVANLPDNVDGAYVLRNGAAEVFSRHAGVLVSSQAPANCSFAWNSERSAFIQQPD